MLLVPLAADATRACLRRTLRQRTPRRLPHASRGAALPAMAGGAQEQTPMPAPDRGRIAAASRLPHVCSGNTPHCCSAML